MERISAACAMDWSIELEKGLRSINPDVAVEAIRKMGSRLEKWGREPKPTMAAYRMYNMVPGEDRLFAAAILLRLAEAFMVGDAGVRKAVVELFNNEFKAWRKRRRSGESCWDVFSRCTEENWLEMMNRVKVVFDREGDLEARAECLLLYGCWAGFAGENADVRYLVLTSLGSKHDVEVIAALYAAGCFCELYDDFASVVLHSLITLVTSDKTSSPVKVAVVRTLAKMRSSFTVLQRAYKAALMLKQNLADKDVSAALSATLSKLTSKSTVVVSEQEKCVEGTGT